MLRQNETGWLMASNSLFIFRRWFWVLIIGLIIFFACEQVLKYTQNTDLIPTVLLVGAGIVPVTFVTYFYEQERTLDKPVHREMPLPLVASSFFVGGAVGLIIAGILEYQTLRNLGPIALLGVGLIEESAKLIFPLAIYLRRQYQSEIDGLLFGVASGMGFATLETMGYGLVAFLQSNGNLGMVEEVLLVRGLLSPAGHAAWTGLVCAVLWRQRERTGRQFNPAVIGIFLLVVVLHAVWDLVGVTSNPFILIAGYLTIGGLSLTLLRRRLNDARRSSSKPEGPPPA